MRQAVEIVIPKGVKFACIDHRVFLCPHGAAIRERLTAEGKEMRLQKMVTRFGVVADAKAVSVFNQLDGLRAARPDPAVLKFNAMRGALHVWIRPPPEQNGSRQSPSMSLCAQ